MQYIHRVFKEELTDDQRTAIRAMIMSRVPKEEVAMSLGMKRCDYFKMIHDARLRLKHRLEADGFFPGVAKKMSDSHLELEQKQLPFLDGTE